MNDKSCYYNCEICGEEKRFVMVNKIESMCINENCGYYMKVIDHGITDQRIIDMTLQVMRYRQGKRVIDDFQ